MIVFACIYLIYMYVCMYSPISQTNLPCPIETELNLCCSKLIYIQPRINMQWGFPELLFTINPFHSRIGIKSNIRLVHVTPFSTCLAKLFERFKTHFIHLFICFCSHLVLIILCGHNFLHATTAELSWHVKNYGLVSWLLFTLPQHNIL